MTVMRRWFVASVAIGATSLAAVLSTVAAASVQQHGAADAEAVRAAKLDLGAGDRTDERAYLRLYVLLRSLAFRPVLKLHEDESAF